VAGGLKKYQSSVREINKEVGPDRKFEWGEGWWRIRRKMASRKYFRYLCH